MEKKIAIVCDWLVSLGGAEKLLGEILRCFPQADLFATIDYLDAEHRVYLHNRKVNTTFMQRLPLIKRFYRHYLPLMPLAVEQINLSAYDLVISSSHAVAKGVITGPDQVHISYVHTPMRYAWDLQHQYLRETALDKKFVGIAARLALHRLRAWDVRSANSVDYFATNSHYISRRINKIYRREANVIHPGIDLSTFTPHPTKEDFYLTASRLVPYKKIDLIVESFNNMPDKKLVVIGDGPDFSKIKRKLKSNITMLGFQSTERLVYHLQRAKAFVFAAEEDFGLLPVEAQSCGTPCIAYGRGGALDTIISLGQDRPTGVFFSEQNVNSIVAAVKLFEERQDELTYESCIENAAKFSNEIFRRKFKAFVEMKMKVVL